MNEKDLNKQLEDAKKLAKEMKVNFSSLVSKINAPEFSKTKEALDSIDFNKKGSVLDIHKIMGEELNKLYKNDNASTK